MDIENSYEKHFSNNSCSDTISQNGYISEWLMFEKLCGQMSQFGLQKMLTISAKFFVAQIELDIIRNAVGARVQ